MSTETKQTNADESAPGEPAPIILQMPIDIRNVSLAVIALLATVFMLSWARAVFIPITFALLASYALTPIVDQLERKIRLPRFIGAAIVMLVLVAGAALAIESLQPQVLNILDLVPRATRKFAHAFVVSSADESGALQRVRNAAEEIDKATRSVTQSNDRPAQKAAAEPGFQFSLRDYLLAGTVSALSGVGQAFVVLVLIYFLLVAGDMFKRKLVRISGDTFAKKKVTVQILDDIFRQVQRYLVVQAGTSALVGLVIWPVFALIGLQNAAAWGIAAAVLHLIPYAGPTFVIIATTMVAYLQFDSIGPVIATAGSAIGIMGVVGFGLVPWLTERVSRISAITVFISLLVWGWLWGVWGLLLGVPIVMAIHAVCQHVEALQPISELLGDETKRSPQDHPNGAQ